MPKTYARITWPNGQEDTGYSLSSTIVEHRKPGVKLSLSEFEAQALRGLDFASRCVMAIYGPACTAAEVEKNRLVAAVRQHQAKVPNPAANVKILTVKACA